MTKWIRVEQDGTISVISEVFVPTYIEIDITQEQFNDILLGKLLYINDMLIDNPNWVAPEPTLEEQVEELRRKKEFGQTTILQFMAETKVEGIFMTDPQLAQQSIGLTQGLVDSLDKGWLLLAINQIKSIPQNMLNTIITSDILLKYRNNIHNFLNIPIVQNYYD